MRCRLLLALAAVAWASAVTAGPQDPRVPAGAAAYLQKRAELGGFTIPRETIAAGIAAGSGPLIVDVRSADAYARHHVAGSVSLPLAALATASSTKDLPRDGRLVIGGGWDTSAVEAMVLLRLAGYDAWAMVGDVADLPSEGTAASRGELAPAPAPTSRPEQTPAPRPAEPEPVAASTPAPKEAPAAAPPLRWRELWLALAAAGLLAGLGVTYLLVVQPWLRGKPLREAIALLATPAPDLGAVETLLGRAVTAGLSKADLPEARFLLAYVRARRGQYAEARTVLSDLFAAGDASPDAAYLDLWLAIREKRWDDAQRTFEGRRDVLEGYLDATRLAAIAYLEHGRQCLARREIDAGLACFERMRELGELTDQIPKDLADHEMIVAIEALFEAKFDLARERFARARERAEQRQAPTLFARTGLLLCDWRSQPVPDVDAELGAVAAEVLAAADSQKQGEAAGLFPRHVLLWHAVSRLFRWLALPPKQGLPTAERQVLAERLASLRRLEPESSDADLIEGLIGYYFATADGERQAAIALLRGARAKGVAVPEVVYLLECEDRLARLHEKRLDNYLLLLKSFLADGSVPYDLRVELLEHLQPFLRPRRLGEDFVITEESVEPSVRELASASEFIEVRFRNLLKGYADLQGRVPATAIDDLLARMQGSREAVTQASGDLRDSQLKAMQIVGEALLLEEPQPAEGP